MSTLPLLTHSLEDDVLAWRHGQPLTVAHFLNDVRRLTVALPSGGHILNVCTDRYHFAVGFAAALLAEKVSLFPPTLAPEMLRQIHQMSPDVVCLTDQPRAMDMPQVLWSDVMPGHGISAGQAADSYAIPQIPAARRAAMVFTSGSTGTPVAHPKSWGGLVRSARAMADRLGLLDGRHHSIVATVAPQHMYGFEFSVLLALHSGSAMAAAHPFYPADIAAALGAVPQPRMLVTTPVHLRVLVAAEVALPAPELVLSATAPLSSELALAVEERLHAPVVEIYGSTETGQIASRRTKTTLEWTLHSGIRLQPGPKGMWAQGGHVEQATLLVDEIEAVDDGHFLLHGRTADLINIAGKRSSLAYLNHQLHAVPGVVDGVFFMPKEAELETPQGPHVTRLMAFVVAPGMDEAAVLAGLRERIDTIFLPRPIVLLESLPRNSTGKLSRDALVALAQAGHAKGSVHAL